jgi:peptide/nickel transport system substrate-binding protein
MKFAPHWRRLAPALPILITLFLLSGLVTVAQDETILVIGHAESTDSYDPARGYTQTSGIVERATYETLVTFPNQDASSIEPMLASSWEVSPDGLTYTFTLRKDAVFSSGNPVTADDVVFSFNRMKNVKSSPAFQADNIASVTATDPQTATITLVAPNPAFLSLLCSAFFSVSDSVVVKENGGTDAADAETTDAAGAYLDSNSAGSGPYILESWDKQVKTVMVRNPNYQGSNEPYFDRVIINNIPEAAAQQAALEAGDVDIALDLTSDQIATLKENSDIAIFSGPGNITHFLLMNEDEAISGPMSDPNVQLAVRYALDYDGFKTLWGGVTPGTNLAVGVAGAFGEDKAFKRDLDEAKKLLSDAGYPDGFETTLSYPDFTFQGVNMNTNAQKIQSDLAEAGITVTLDVGDLQTKLESYRNGTEGFAYWFWGPDFIDAADFLSFLPGGNVATDRAGWKPESLSEEVQGWIDQAKVESDPAKRTEIFNQLQDFAQHNSPFAPFNQPAVQTAFRANLQGYVWHPQWLVDVALLSRS